MNEAITVTLNDTGVTQVALTCGEVYELADVTDGVFTVPDTMVTDGAVIEIGMITE